MKGKMEVDSKNLKIKVVISVFSISHFVLVGRDVFVILKMIKQINGFFINAL